MDLNTALYESIKSLNIIPVKKLDECFAEAKNLNKDLHSVLLSKDLMSDENIGRLKADIYGLPFIQLQHTPLDQTVASLIPQTYARQNHCLVIKQDDVTTTVAISNGDDKNLIKQLQTRFTDKLTLFYATSRDLAMALKIYQDDPKATFDKLLSSGIDAAKKEPAEPPIIQIVDTIIRFAYERGASDIHIEPTSDQSLVRFRVDGMMHDIVSLPLDIHPRIATRIKVMADLRTDENQSAQDGKLTLSLEEEKLDVRVSLVPIVAGESIVLRLLAEKSRQFSLLDLGLSSADAQKIEIARKKPHGMILSTGPTGSGKTTTLYALLKLLNERSVTIMTIEDPVEYQIEGINQIQVNKATGLTFADGLRSVVRQDPDIILVGEVRDNETADIAINSAMTGHLVLSTLHTNDASTAIPRFMDMDVEPFLIASTLNIIVAQRLVRKICTQCRTSTEVEVDSLSTYLSKDILAIHFGTGKTRIYKGTGCRSCNNLGYLGRIGIFEIMVMTDELKEAITKKLDAGEIQKLAIEQGMTTMLDDGIAKVKSGITTIEEIMRVTSE